MSQCYCLCAEGKRSPSYRLYVPYCGRDSTLEFNILSRQLVVAMQIDSVASRRVLSQEFRAASSSDVFSICHAHRKPCHICHAHRKPCHIRDMNMRMSAQPRCVADSVWVRCIWMTSRRQ